MDILDGIAAQLSAVSRVALIAYVAGFVSCAVIGMIF